MASRFTQFYIDEGICYASHFFVQVIDGWKLPEPNQLLSFLVRLDDIVATR